MLDILQIDRVELPTPLDPKKPGMLINVHLSSRCTDLAEMDAHGRSLLEKVNLRKYAGAAVTYWFREGSRKERLHMVERVGS